MKRQQLSESLRGPAADVIRNLKTCVAMDYIDDLYAVFRRVETTADLKERVCLNKSPE